MSLPVDQISILDLSTLSHGVPALTTRKAGVHMEACVWCLLECNHENQVILKVDSESLDEEFIVFWPESSIDIEALNRAYNKDDAPEQGAEAIAFLLIRECTDYTAIRRSITSTGIDYWLDYKNSEEDQLFSQASARLEVSGILQQSATNKPQYRVNRKVLQTRRSDCTSFPVYVIVVEFSQPFSMVDFRHV